MKQNIGLHGIFVVIWAWESAQFLMSVHAQNCISGCFRSLTPGEKESHRITKYPMELLEKTEWVFRAVGRQATLSGSHKFKTKENRSQRLRLNHKGHASVQKYKWQCEILSVGPHSENVIKSIINSHLTTTKQCTC